MHIFQIDVSQIEDSVSTEFLDTITLPEHNRGKNCKPYWMIKTDSYFTTPTNEGYIINTLLAETQRRGMNTLMINKKTPD